MRYSKLTAPLEIEGYVRKEIHFARKYGQVMNDLCYSLENISASGTSLTVYVHSGIQNSTVKKVMRGLRDKHDVVTASALTVPLLWVA